MTDQVAHLTNLYRAVVADSGTDKISFRTAVHEVAAQIQPMIDRGELRIDTLTWVNAVMTKIDKAEKASTDATLSAIARGEDDLGVDTPAYLDRVACLGGGARKAYRFLSAADIDEMDELRHRNVRSVNRSYHKEWKPGYLGWREVLRRNLTIGAAVAAGDLPAVEATLLGGAA